MEEDIRRKGELYLHQQRFGKRWRKVWCVVVAEGWRSVARLELYEHKHMSFKEGSSKRKHDKRVIRLRECIRISENDMGDCPKNCATFLMETSEKLYVFAAHHSEVKGWIMSLCEQAFPDMQSEQKLPRQNSIYPESASSYQSREMQENSLYETAEIVRDYLVIAVGTEAALRCNLHGEYILTPQSDCLLLKHCKTKEVLFKWPYCYVRKFGQDALSFSFEAGRRCESGEGNFEFATHQGERLFSVVCVAIQNLPRSSTAQHSSLGSVDQSIVQETVATDEIYDNTTATLSLKQPDCLPEGDMQRAVQKQHPPMLNPAFKSFSLNTIEPQSKSQVTSINTNLENQEPVYATVSKAQPKPTSPTDPKMHWQNLRKALHESASFRDSFKADSDISQLSALAAPHEGGSHEETMTGEDPTDLLGDSIQQLAINDALKNISAEAIYAEPQDYQFKAEWNSSAVYDEPKEVIIVNQRAHDVADHTAEHDFFYSPDIASSHAMAAQSNPNQSSVETFSTYDNFKLKGRRI
ncbi:docking protein 1-like [Myxocyprinus asiaticus]|uniref:docking protein 1-like n=1 Tax=Myxocyprinus asiaticus TaxID=70543 RepID=UPI002223ED69|nr:docking protein 1-like [Myxocyprinus asiaticus]